MRGRHEATVASGEAGLRLDRFLRKVWPGVPLSAIYRRIDRGEVRVNGRRAEPGTRLRPGDRLALPEPPAAPVAAARGSAGPVLVLHEDAHVLAVDKPAGLRLHGGRDDLVTRVLARLGPRAVTRSFRPAPAHQLDRETSGVVLFGRTPEGLRGLAAAFRARAVKKRYVALVFGAPPGQGVTRLALARREEAPRGPRVAADPRGRPAETEWRVVRALGEASLVELTPRTGRTHQLRVHLAALGHPILGDDRYGTPQSEGLSRALGVRGLALHAAEVAFRHPVSGRPLRIAAPLPPDFSRGPRPASSAR